MAVRITIVNELGDDFATPAELAEMTDDEIIELVREDVLGYLLDNGTWSIERTRGGQSALGVAIGDLK